MGDPQAPFEKVMAILARHDLIAADGRLRSHVQLTSMGDHFDWGGPEERKRASQDGLRLLEWLASHPAEQVELVLGNHDLARAGELASFDDGSFEQAFAEAVPAYAASKSGDDEPERRFLERWPEVPSAECVARDFSTFSVAQRHLVESLVRARRFRVAFAPSPSLLLVHAGVTRDELTGLGLGPDAQRDAVKVAAALNEALDRALQTWASGRLAIPGLHRPGDAEGGEGRGMFYHRPELPERGDPGHFVGPLRRRFDPRRLPSGLTQAIGHIRDAKCRTLLGDWALGPAAGEGPLRSLVVEGERGRYTSGAETGHDPGDPRVATMLFTDGSMSHAPVEAYELLDLDRRQRLDV